ncbi:MAG: VOC family protein [Gammaproteobacteria bacterium]
MNKFAFSARHCAWLAAVAIVAACSTVPVNLPSVTEQPTNNRLPGKIIWHDLLTDKPAESQRFYEELFGWEFERIGPNFGAIASANYTLIRHNGRLIGGMIDEARLNTTEEISQWIALMSTADIDAAVAKLTQAGGKVFTPPTDLADRGRIAVVNDPQGAVFALLETRDGDPADAEPAINDFLWNEVWSDDVDAATAFYSELAGLDSVDKAVSGDSAYRYLADDDTPRFGIMRKPVEGLTPLWATYIRVADPAAIVARVEELGGRVLLDANDRPAGGKVALIEGPSGAGIALQTWEPPEDRAGN